MATDTKKDKDATPVAPRNAKSWLSRACSWIMEKWSEEDEHGHHRYRFFIPFGVFFAIVVAVSLLSWLGVVGGAESESSSILQTQDSNSGFSVLEFIEGYLTSIPVLIFLFACALLVRQMKEMQKVGNVLIGVLVALSLYYNGSDWGSKTLDFLGMNQSSPQASIHEAYGGGGEYALSKDECVYEAYRPGQRISWKHGGNGFYLQSLSKELEARTFYIGRAQFGPGSVFIDRAQAGRSDFVWREVEGMLKICGPDEGVAVLIITKR
jgi:hypothetical protein